MGKIQRSSFINPIAEFGSDLQDFYYQVINKVVDLSDQDDVSTIKRFVQEDLRNALDAFKSSPPHFLYNSSLKRCSYMLKFAPCVVNILCHHFLELFGGNLFKQIIDSNRKKLNLCFLGGGPGTEMVALIKTFSTLLTKTDTTVVLEMTIIDCNNNWKFMIQNILRTLVKTKFLDPSKMELRFRFLKADLRQSGNCKVLEILKNADIVTVVHLLCDLPRWKSGKDMTSIQEIFKHIKVGSLIFYMDNARGFQYDKMNFIAWQFKDIKLIYGPILNKTHVTSLNTIRKHNELYRQIFNKSMCPSHCKVSVAAWMKILATEITCSVRPKEAKAEYNNNRQTKEKMQTVILGQPRKNIIASQAQKESNWEERNAETMNAEQILTKFKMNDAEKECKKEERIINIVTTEPTEIEKDKDQRTRSGDKISKDQTKVGKRTRRSKRKKVERNEEMLISEQTSYKIKASLGEVESGVRTIIPTKGDMGLDDKKDKINEGMMIADQISHQIRASLVEVGSEIRTMIRDKVLTILAQMETNHVEKKEKPNQKNEENMIKEQNEIQKKKNRVKNKRKKMKRNKKTIVTLQTATQIESNHIEKEDKMNKNEKAPIMQQTPTQFKSKLVEKEVKISKNEKALIMQQTPTQIESNHVEKEVKINKNEKAMITQQTPTQIKSNQVEKEVKMSKNEKALITQQTPTQIKSNQVEKEVKMNKNEKALIMQQTPTQLKSKLVEKEVKISKNEKALIMQQTPTQIKSNQVEKEGKMNKNEKALITQQTPTQIKGNHVEKEVKENKINEKMITHEISMQIKANQIKKEENQNNVDTLVRGKTSNKIRLVQFQREEKIHKITTENGILRKMKWTHSGNERKQKQRNEGTLTNEESQVKFKPKQNVNEPKNNMKCKEATAKQQKQIKIKSNPADKELNEYFKLDSEETSTQKYIPRNILNKSEGKSTPNVAKVKTISEKQIKVNESEKEDHQNKKTMELLIQKRRQNETRFNKSENKEKMKERSKETENMEQNMTKIKESVSRNKSSKKEETKSAIFSKETLHKLKGKKKKNKGRKKMNKKAIAAKMGKEQKFRIQMFNKVRRISKVLRLQPSRDCPLILHDFELILCLTKQKSKRVSTYFS